MDAATVYHRRVQAMLSFEEGRLPEAEARLGELIAAIGDPQTRQMRDHLCQCLIDRATVRRIANNSAEALEDLAKAERLVAGLVPLSQKPMLLNIWLTRAKVYAAPFSPVYDPQAALRCLGEVRKLGWTSWIADELESDVAFRARQWDRSAQLALQAAEALASEGWDRAVASCKLRAGRAYLEMGDLRRASALLAEAHDFLEKLGPPDQLTEALLGLARLRSSYGEHDAAWEHARAALDGAESLVRHFRLVHDQQRFVADKLRYYDHAFDIGLAKSGPEGRLRAWTVAERAKSLYLCQLVANADVPLFEGVDPGRVKRLRELEAQLDACEQELGRLGAEGLAGPRGSALKEQLQSLSRQRQELLDQMMRDNPRWAALRTPPRFELEMALKQLASTWAPVSYFWCEREGGAALFVFYTDRARAPQCVQVAWSQGELEALDESRLRLQKPLHEMFSDWMSMPSGFPLPGALAEKVVPRQVIQGLQAGQRLLVSPHGRLRSFPIHAVSAGDGKVLISRWPVQYIPTFALLPLRRRGLSPDDVLLMGCPENAFNDRALEEAEGEIEALYEIWAAARPGRARKSLIPIAGSPEQAGLPIEEWGGFGVLHLACHGHFPEGRPFDAALRLGADAVRASEFFTVQLKAALVSLSACSLGRQSGSHSEVEVMGDEWVGLYLPLFYAGAGNLVVSLWEADSETAQSFMKALHEALSQGAPPADAFQRAMKGVAGDPAPLWANWYLVGLPD